MNIHEAIAQADTEKMLIKKIPEHYILSAEAMDIIVRLLYVVAYPAYDIRDDDQQLAQEMLEVYDNA